MINKGDTYIKDIIKEDNLFRLIVLSLVSLMGIVLIPKLIIEKIISKIKSIFI